MTISDIINKNSGEEVDFLNIDIEGFDEMVLLEVDFDTFHPKVICIEDYSNDVQEILQSRMAKKLSAVGYSLIARVGPSAIFQSK
jgi:hypothetical protein